VRALQPGETSIAFEVFAGRPFRSPAFDEGLSCGLVEDFPGIFRGRGDGWTGSSGGFGLLYVPHLAQTFGGACCRVRLGFPFFSDAESPRVACYVEVVQGEPATLCSRTLFSLVVYCKCFISSPLLEVEPPSFFLEKTTDP